MHFSQSLIEIKLAKSRNYLTKHHEIEPAHLPNMPHYNYSRNAKKNALFIANNAHLTPITKLSCEKIDQIKDEIYKLRTESTHLKLSSIAQNNSSSTQHHRIRIKMDHRAAIEAQLKHSYRRDRVKRQSKYYLPAISLGKIRDKSPENSNNISKEQQHVISHSLSQNLENILRLKKQMKQRQSKLPQFVKQQIDKAMNISVSGWRKTNQQYEFLPIQQE